MSDVYVLHVWQYFRLWLIIFVLSVKCFHQCTELRWSDTASNIDLNSKWFSFFKQIITHLWHQKPGMRANCLACERRTWNIFYHNAFSVASASMDLMSMAFYIPAKSLLTVVFPTQDTLRSISNQAIHMCPYHCDPRFDNRVLCTIQLPTGHYFANGVLLKWKIKGLEFESWRCCARHPVS